MRVRRFRVLSSLATAALLAALFSATPAGAAATGPLGSVNFAGSISHPVLYGSISNLDCLSVGNCVAAGVEGVKGSSVLHPFIAKQTAGYWGAVKFIALAPGTSAYSYYITGLSCASMGTCAFAGYYYKVGKPTAPFGVAESAGVWGPAHALAQLAPFVSPTGKVTSVSCAGANSCAITGSFNNMPFVVAESNSAWSSPTYISSVYVGARIVGGTASQYGGQVSCISPGNCEVVGDFRPTVAGVNAEYHVSLHNGTWSRATALPGARMDPAGTAPPVNTLDCSSAGNCALGGQTDIAGVVNGYTRVEPYTATEKNGVWQTPKVLNGAVTMNVGMLGGITALACPANGSCVAAGFALKAPMGPLQGIVVNMTNGVWGTPHYLADSAQYNAFSPHVISCSSASRCVIVANASPWSAFAYSSKGVWSTSNLVASPGSFNSYAAFSTVSCVASGACEIMGSTGSFFSAGLATTFATNVAG